MREQACAKPPRRKIEQSVAVARLRRDSSRRGARGHEALRRALQGRRRPCGAALLVAPALREAGVVGCEGRERARRQLPHAAPGLELLAAHRGSRRADRQKGLGPRPGRRGEWRQAAAAQEVAVRVLVTGGLLAHVRWQRDRWRDGRRHAPRDGRRDGRRRSSSAKRKNDAVGAAAALAAVLADGPLQQQVDDTRRGALGQPDGRVGLDKAACRGTMLIGEIHDM